MSTPAEIAQRIVDMCATISGITTVTQTYTGSPYAASSLPALVVQEEQAQYGYGAVGIMTITRSYSLTLYYDILGEEHMELTTTPRTDIRTLLGTIPRLFAADSGHRLMLSGEPLSGVQSAVITGDSGIRDIEIRAMRYAAVRFTLKVISDTLL